MDIHKSANDRKVTASTVNLKTAIKKALADLNVRLSIWMKLMDKLQEQSREKDSDFLKNAREQIVILRELLRNEELELIEVYSLVGQCDNNVMAMAVEVREIKIVDFDDFMSELNESITVCNELLLKSEGLDNLGSANQKILIQYMNRVLVNLLHQKEKLEMLRPLMFPRLPDVQQHVDKQNNFKNVEFCQQLDGMVNMIEDRLKELGAEPQEITELQK